MAARVVSRRSTEPTYRIARDCYGEVGVDTNEALRRLEGVAVSIQCWQGDDVGGFEADGGALGDGLAVTGSYPGKPRTADELRGDFEQALKLIPGKHRFNLHASYGESTGRRPDRDQLGPEQFRNWIAWARELSIGLDFNQTYFSHAKVKGGMTLTHPDRAVRRFWIEHGIRCREIGACIGRILGKACLTNLWIPDGMKDTPADRKAPRERLLESLDAVFRMRIDPRHNRDSVEPKLFGIGAESYTAGSHEFYLGYAVSRKLMLTLDSGHYHPTESISDKISSVLMYLPEMALHVSRGVRWDSDHVVTLTDDLAAIAQEVVWGDYLDRVRIGLDYFDASINRVAAWVIGTRALLKALLQALLCPIQRIRAAEAEGDYTTRLALQEESKALPWGAVWDQYCRSCGVPSRERWLSELRKYESRVQLKRG
jgi:L-rhamnose isomerase